MCPHLLIPSTPFLQPLQIWVALHQLSGAGASVAAGCGTVPRLGTAWGVEIWPAPDPAEGGLWACAQTGNTPASQQAGASGGGGSGQDFTRLTLGSHSTPWNVGGLGTGKMGEGHKGEAADLKSGQSSHPSGAPNTTAVVSFLLPEAGDTSRSFLPSPVTLDMALTLQVWC